MENARPQRIVILGSSGGGKSTLARQLGESLDLPVVHLDRLFWKPGWVESPRAEFDARVLEVTATECWVIDGNYSRTLPARIERADLIIYIEISRYRALWRVMRRWRSSLGRTRPDMGEGCPERIDFGFLSFVWHYPNRRGPEHRQMAEDAGAAGKTLVVLKAGREVSEFAKASNSLAANSNMPSRD